MGTDEREAVSPSGGRRFTTLQVLGIAAAVAAVAVAATAVLLRVYLFPKAFEPVTLKPGEERVLEAKLERLDPAGAGGREAGRAPSPNLEPERYTEEGASREVVLTERELNALLARNTDLARKAAIDLSEDLVSLKLLVPVDEDFPFFGGQTLRVRAGVELALSGGKPRVVLKGVSLMGVPIPSAWLGGLKNVDLVREYGQAEGFWSSFAAGVEDLRVTEGALRLRLRE